MKLILTFTLLFLSSCFFSEDGKIEINPLNSSFGTSNAQVSSVSIVNDQLVVNGSGLSGITKVQITGPSSFDHTFSIESKSDSNLIANGVSNIAFALDAIFSLTVTDANGSATYSVTFTLQDDAVTTSKILDGAVTAAKLSDMGAGTGQVLKYNGTTWVPGDLNALTYAGTWDASTATAPNVAPAAGEYYIVSVAAAGIDISDGSGSRNFVLGDWLVYNGSTTRWDKIDNASYVTSFNGRTGAVTPATNDYTWAQIDKSASVLSQINDVEAPAGDGSDTGKVLKWNNATSTWELGDDLSGGGAGSVTSTEIADGSITNDDVNAAAAIAYSKLNIADGDLTIAKTSGLQTTLDAKLPLAGGTMTGNIVMSGAQTVDGVDVSALATSVSTNTSTIAGLDTDDITEATNQYFTNARAIAAPITGFTSGAGTVAATDTVLQAIQKLDGNVTALDTDDVTEATNLYHTTARARTAAVVNSTAGTETDQAASVSAMKTYVAAQVSGAGAVLADGSVAMTGNLDLGNNQLRLKSDNTNYVQMIAPNSLAATYTLTMPADDGTSGQVLSTNGTGTLSWVSPASGSVTSVTGTAPIVSSGGTTPAISIAQANGSTDGFLDSADWTTFNNKQAAITTGTTAQYLRGDLSLSTFNTDVIGSAITGFTSGAGTVAATDTVLQAVQKLDGNIAANTSTISGLDTDDITEATNQYFTNARAIAAPITGFTSGAGTVAATDTVLQAIQKLDGNIAASGDILDGGNTTGSAVTIGTNDAQSLNLETNNSTAMTILSGGNVGIGTTTPDSPLDVRVSSTPVFIGSGTDTYNPTLGSQLVIRTNSQDAYIGMHDSTGGVLAFGFDHSEDRAVFAVDKGSGAGQDIAFITNMNTVSGQDNINGIAPKMIIKGNGQVGVGTVSPTSNLELQGNLSTALTGTVTVGAGTAAVTGSGTAFTTELAVGDAIKIGTETFTVQAIASATALTLDSNHVAGATGVAATSDPNLMSVKTGDAQEVFTVNSEGNVGVGITGPGAKLDVAGDIRFDTNLFVDNAGAHYFKHNGGTASTDKFIFRFSDNEDVLTVSGDGNVGIGATSPSTALEVSGTVTATAFAGDGSALTGISATGVAAGAGTVGAPSMSFSTDTNTGFYSSGADQIGVSANGASIFDFTATGLTSPTTGGSHITTGNGTAAAPTFSFAGDTDTGWYRAAADTLAAATAGSERMRIDSSGNVGVGTTSPSQKLHVYDGTFRVDTPSPGGVVSGMTLNGNGTNFIVEMETAATTLRNSGGSLLFNTGSVDHMIVNASGNIGVGTTSPSYTFEVSSADAAFAGYVQNTNASGYGLGIKTAGTTSSQYAFDIENGSASIFRVRNDGNVGIGTSSPSYLLDVAGDAHFQRSGGSQFFIQTPSTDTRIFSYDNGGTPNNLVFNPGGGSVAVGTISPAATAAFDVTSTTQGFLPPRMTTAQRTAISTPAEGLIVFDTDEDALHVYQNSSWSKLADTSEVAFHVHKNSTAQTVTTNTWTVLSWSTEVFDTNSNFASNRFTPTVAGKYFIGASIYCTDNTSWCHPAVSKNGTRIFSGGSEDNGAIVPVSGVVDMNGTTDYLELQAYNNGGTNIDGTAVYTYFYGYLISGGTGSGGSSDNLGNHTAGQNIVLGSHYLSGDGGNEGISVDSTGKVGIGTATPATILQVRESNPDVYITSDDTGQSDIYFGGSTTPTKGRIQYSDNSDFIALWTNSTQRLTVDTSGNVGIGTAGPTAELDVYEASAANIILRDSTVGLKIRTNGSDTGWIGTTTNHDFQVVSNNSAKIHVENSGEVGIGTTSPKASLQVGTATSLFTAGGTENLHIGRNIYYDGTNYKRTVADNDSVFMYMNSNGETYFYSNSDANTAVDSNITIQPNMVIKKNGDIGMGTTNPQADLHIEDSTPAIRITDSDTGADHEISGNSGAGHMYFFADTNSDVVGSDMGFYIDGVNLLHIEEGGNVGIGDTTPSYKLDVNGTIRGFGITDSSDERLKNNIEPLAGSLEKVLMLQGVSYYWNEDLEGREEDLQIGLIAQKVEEVFPELVETDNEGMKSVNYSHMVAPLIEAAKELDRNQKMFEMMQKGIDEEQNRKIASLEKELEEVKSENQEMKNFLCTKFADAPFCQK